MAQDEFSIANRAVDRIDTEMPWRAVVAASRAMDPGFVVAMTRVDLSEEVRAVLFSRYVGEWDTARIAEVLHISTEEVEQRLRIGEEALRRVRE